MFLDRPWAGFADGQRRRNPGPRAESLVYFARPAVFIETAPPPVIPKKARRCPKIAIVDFATSNGVAGGWAVLVGWVVVGGPDTGVAQPKRRRRRVDDA